MGRRGFKIRSLRLSFVLSVGVLSAGALSAAAQGVRVSAPLERVTIAGEVREVALDASGEWLAYVNVLDAEWTTETRLFALRPESDGAPELLSSGLSRSSAIALTPGSGQVVYSVGNGRGLVPGLYRVRTGGGLDPVRISPVHGTFTFDPEGTRVVFSNGAAGGLGLFVAPLDGSAAPLQLAGTDAFGERVSPAGDRVVFLARGAGVPDELYSVLLDGSAAPVRLNVTPVPFGDVLEFEITPDGTRVVYRADQDLDLADELYSVPIDGSAPPVKLNVPLARRQQDVTAFRIAPDGAHVVYRADQDEEGVFELFSVPIGGGVPPTEISGALTAGGDVTAEFEIDPSGRHVLFVADAAVDQRFELYRTDLLGRGAPVRVSGELVDGGDVVQLWIDPRGGRVVYRADQVTDGVFGLFSERLGRPAGPLELAPSSGPDVRLGGGRAVFTLAPHLYSVPVDGSLPAVRLDPELAPGGTVRPDFRIEPDGAHVLFRADLETAGLAELLRVPIAGGEPQRLNAPVGVERIVGAVRSVIVSADSSRLLYSERVSESTESEHTRLFARPLDPAATATRLFPAAQSVDDDAADLVLSPDGSRALFSTGSTEGEYFPRLFGAPSDGHLPAVQLNTPDQSYYGIGQVVTTPDGATVVWSEDGGSRGIRAAPIDGSAPPLELVTGGDEFQAHAFLLTPQGTTLVYLDPLAPATSDAVRLMAVPVDGSSAPVPLNAPVPPLGSRGPFRITADGTRVVYRTDQDVDEVHELYVVPVDGSAAPVKLSGTLVAGGDVQSFQLDAAGTRAVFLADRLADGERELFAVPLDASADPVALSDLPGPGRTTLDDYALAPDGQRVVFRSDLAVAGAIELWSAPTDGSAAPVRLSGPLVAGGRVGAFQVAPDGKRVVYAADQTVDERVELFGVPIDGSGPPVVLSGPFAAGADVVGAFAIRADSRQVVYVADQDTDDVFELFGAPLDRARGSVRLSGPMVPGGDVRPTGFVLTPDGRAVLYVADQEVDGAPELFRSALDPVPALRRR